MKITLTHTRHSSRCDAGHRAQYLVQSTPFYFSGFTRPKVDAGWQAELNCGKVRVFMSEGEAVELRDRLTSVLNAHEEAQRANAAARGELRRFRVVSIASNTNSFGLRGHVIVTPGGEAYEVARADGGGNAIWKQGEDVLLPVRDDGNVEWAKANCELPRRLAAPPLAALKEIFGIS